VVRKVQNSDEVPVTDAASTAALDLAARLFEAALAPDLWPPLLARLAAGLGAERAMLLRIAGGRRVVLATSEFTPADVRRLAGRRSHPDAARLSCPPEYCELQLDADSRLRLLLDRREIAREASALVAELGPRVARAWRVTDARAASRRREGWRSETLEQLPLGVMVLDVAGRALRANGMAHAILAAQRELALVDGVLHADSGVLARSISELLERAAQPERRGATLEVHLPRDGGRVPVEAIFVASPRFADADPEALAVALLSDPERADGRPAAVLARRYELGFEQAQILDLLLRGEGIPKIARLLGVPREAIASGLRELYERLGTTRQIDLVKLLLSLRTSTSE